MTRLKSYFRFRISLPHHDIDNLENDIGVDSCGNIIQDNSKSPFESFLDTADWKRLENVEEPKEEKSADHEEECFGNPEHRDEKTHDLVDDDLLIIFFPVESFGIFRSPNREEEKTDKRDFIDRSRDIRKKVIDGNGDEGSQRSRGDRRVSDSEARCEKEEQLVQNKYLTALTIVGGL